jgi:AcrR family transcriptional regulator
MVTHRLEIRTIVDAAAEEFARHGFEGMSMRVLADKCSVTAAALYYHFSSKEALYDEVCNRIFDDIVVTIDAALEGARTPEERLERFVAALFDEFSKSTMLVLTQRDVINASIEPERSFASPHYRQLFARIGKLQAQVLGDTHDEARAFAFGSLLFGYCSLLVYSQRDSGLPLAEYRAQRKQELIALCRNFPGLNGR